MIDTFLKGMQFLTYHDTLGGASATMTNPQNQAAGMWVLVGLVAVVIGAIIIFSKQNKAK